MIIVRLKSSINDFFLEPRGFGFVTFTDMESVDNVLACEEHKINDKVVS